MLHACVKGKSVACLACMETPRRSGLFIMTGICYVILAFAIMAPLNKFANA